MRIRIYPDANPAISGQASGAARFFLQYPSSQIWHILIEQALYGVPPGRIRVKQLHLFRHLFHKQNGFSVVLRCQKAYCEPSQLYTLQIFHDNCKTSTNVAHPGDLWFSGKTTENHCVFLKTQSELILNSKMCQNMPY